MVASSMGTKYIQGSAMSHGRLTPTLIRPTANTLERGGQLLAVSIITKGAAEIVNASTLMRLM